MLEERGGKRERKGRLRYGKGRGEEGPLCACGTLRTV